MRASACVRRRGFEREGVRCVRVCVCVCACVCASLAVHARAECGCVRVWVRACAGGVQAAGAGARLGTRARRRSAALAVQRLKLGRRNLKSLQRLSYVVRKGALHGA
jgi:hypothetical protein